MKNNGPDIPVNKRTFWQYGDIRGDHRLQLRPREICNSEIQMHHASRIEPDVVVRVVDSGNHGATAEINLPRLRPGERFDFRGIARGDDAFAANRERLHVGMRGVAREYLAVEQHEIWRGILRPDLHARDCCKRSKRQHDKPHSQFAFRHDSPIRSADE